MKKLQVNFVSILFAVLCLAFTACNQGITAGKGTGTVRVVIGGGSARSVDPASGLPVFDEMNTKIIVTKEDGSKLAEGTTSLTIQVPVGKKITVEVVVTTVAGVWRGATEYTVKAGDNPIAVKLSKTPKSMKNILLRVVKDDPTDPEIALQLGDKELLTNVKINGNYMLPVTARDGNGRVYALYDKGGSRHFTRFDAEGNEDAGFETAIQGKLPSSLGRIKTMTVDPKTGTLFVAVVTTQPDIYAVTENGHNTFTCSNSVNLATLPDIKTNDEITAMAAYNGELFLTVCRKRLLPVSKPNKLFACTAALSGTALTLTEKNAAELDELRTSAVMNVPTQCTGLFADESGVYCLLREQRLRGGMLYYMVGVLACYSRDDNTVTYLKKHPKAGTNDEYLPFDSDAFANPVGFIGSDEDYIYIADDGINIKYLNENWRINGNKNRIAAFNRKTQEITFSNTEATWYAEKPVYKFPETPVLLWEKDTSGNFRYWTSAAGTDPFSSDNKLFEASTSEKPTDIFCYDQEGNLYILWKNSSNDYKVRRFALKADSTYDTAGADSSTIGAAPRTPQYIAVDVSDGQNCLYYGTKNGDWRVSKVTWSGAFSSSSISSATEVISGITEEMTALAANKDGVFVGVRELDSSQTKYTLKVGKYAKDTGAAYGEKIIVKDHLLQTPHNVPLHESYTDYHETLAGLQVLEGVLYAITSKLEKNMKYGDPAFSYHGIDEFKSSGILYKIGKTEEGFSGNVEDENKYKKNFISPEGSNPGIGYGFYRFIAVKPKKVVIASDGACAIGGNTSGALSPQPDPRSDNKVLEYDLDGNLNLPEEKKAGGKFSMELRPGSGFEWK